MQAPFLTHDLLTYDPGNEGLPLSHTPRQSMPSERSAYAHDDGYAISSASHVKVLSVEANKNRVNLRCNPEDVARIFFELMKEVDFSPEIAMLRVKFYERTLRKNLLLDLQATYIGLWALALTHSFPDIEDEIFMCFQHMYVASLPKSLRTLQAEKILCYKEMVCQHGSQNFSEVSRHLFSFTKVDKETFKADVLRLSLALRKHYVFIFQRLV